MAHEHEHEHKHEDHDKLIREVGAFSYKALLNAKNLVKPGAKLLDVAEKAEKFVIDNGFGCAFPINLSINSQAAHYSPSFLDDKVFTDNDVVKVDFGVSKEGILGDCAVTVDLSGKYGSLVEASEDALKNAIAVVKAGVPVSTIGGIIEKTIEKKGFKPIKNLGGHGVEEHDLHTHPFIPNYNNADFTLLEEGMVIAIEPFATDGKKDLIHESDVCEIYEFAGESLVRSPYARAAQAEIMKKYINEPFAVRWLSGAIKDRFNLYVGINELVRSGSLQPHPVLVGNGEGIITQSEAQVLVTRDGCEILTR
ncbi:MAG: type II methionyl aminopeptidase [Candidatus Micrarchaeales archaeon]